MGQFICAMLGETMTDQHMLSVPVHAGDHSEGSAKAPVTMVGYGDYECPHCAKSLPVIKTLKVVLKDDLRVVFRHFPLHKVHPNAQKAAEATEAAAAQGAFWAMHNTLYKNQRALDRESLIQYARMLELDVERFTRELDAGVYAERVHADRAGGEASGVNGTPRFFFNGVMHEGAYDYDTLYEAIMQAKHNA